MKEKISKIKKAIHPPLILQKVLSFALFITSENIVFFAFNKVRLPFINSAVMRYSEFFPIYIPASDACSILCPVSSRSEKDPETF